MSIIPAGKRRDQVNQGELKNKSILESDLFQKFGQGASALVDDPVQQRQPPQPNRQMQDTMNSGGLGHDGIADQHEIDSAPPGDMAQGQHGGGVQPAGAGMGGGSPASKYLGADPEAQQQGVDVNAFYNAEEQKINQFIGNDFGYELIENGDGTFTVGIESPRPIQDPEGFLDELVRRLGGQRSKTKRPGMATNKPLQITYTPAGMPQKVTKGKNR